MNKVVKNEGFLSLGLLHGCDVQFPSPPPGTFALDVAGPWDCRSVIFPFHFVQFYCRGLF